MLTFCSSVLAYVALLRQIRHSHCIFTLNFRFILTTRSCQLIWWLKLLTFQWLRLFQLHILRLFDIKALRNVLSGCLIGDFNNYWWLIKTLVSLWILSNVYLSFETRLCIHLKFSNTFCIWNLPVILLQWRLLLLQRCCLILGLINNWTVMIWWSCIFFLLYLTFNLIWQSFKQISRTIIQISLLQMLTVLRCLVHSTLVFSLRFFSYGRTW